MGNFVGEAAALMAALIWAVASLIYARVGTTLAPWRLNFVKGVVSLGLLFLTLGILQRPFPADSAQAALLLALSGIVGIGLGDTCYFAALNRIGPRRTLLLETLSPPLTALLAFGFLQEQLTSQQIFGISLTAAGVIWVMLERVNDRPTPLSDQCWGWALGLFAALSQAGGAVLSRAALATTAMDPAWSTVLRLVAGTGVLLLGFCRPGAVRVSWPKGKKLWGAIALTAFFSTYLGIWLQQISLKYAPAGIAQSLSSTSPLFVLPLVALQGEIVSGRAIAGVLITLVGVVLVMA